MGRPLNFNSAASVSLVELAAAFTASFTGYFSPMVMTVERLSQRVRLEQLDLQNSLLADDEGKLVGMALLGLRGREGWCGGFGITPEFRGHGHAHQLMAEFIARALGCEVIKLSLEVLTRNTAAIHLYQRAGMHITRDLLILERRGNVGDATDHTLELAEADPTVLLRHFGRLHAWRPAWQRDLATLITADPMRGVYLGDEAAPDAYALLVTRPDGITQVLDLAASREEHADALSAAIAQRYGALRVVNEPEESLFIAALLAHGFTEDDRQHEMSCEIAT